MVPQCIENTVRVLYTLTRVFHHMEIQLTKLFKTTAIMSFSGLYIYQTISIWKLKQSQSQLPWLQQRKLT